jgi:hypothetical protein
MIDSGEPSVNLFGPRRLECNSKRLGNLRKLSRQKHSDELPDCFMRLDGLTSRSPGIASAHLHCFLRSDPFVAAKREPRRLGGELEPSPQNRGQGLPLRSSCAQLL